MYQPITYEQMAHMDEDAINRTVELLRQCIDPDIFIPEQDSDRVPISFRMAVKKRLARLENAEDDEGSSIHESELSTVIEDTREIQTEEGDNVAIYEDNDTHNLAGEQRAEEDLAKQRSPRSAHDWHLANADHEGLISLGGRPSFPISTRLKVEQHPRRYHHRIAPWELKDTNGRYGAVRADWRMVYKMQLRRWQNFRHWQYDNRGIRDNSLSSEVKEEFVERCRGDEISYQAQYTSRTQENAHLETFANNQWSKFCKERERRRQNGREVPEGSTFAEYVGAVKARLRRHGFHRLFELREDPAEQTNRETWIEYLSYEYWWYDQQDKLQIQATERCRLFWQQMHTDKRVGKDAPPDMWRPQRCLGMDRKLQNLKRQLAEAQHTEPRAFAKIRRLAAEVCEAEVTALREQEYIQCCDDLYERNKEFREQHRIAQWVLEELGVVEEEEDEDRAAQRKIAAAVAACGEPRGKRRRNTDEDANGGVQTRSMRKRVRLGEIGHVKHEKVEERRRLRTPESVTSDDNDENKENGNSFVPPMRYDSDSEYSDASYTELSARAENRLHGADASY